MKKKAFAIINWNNKLEQVFLTRVSAQGWLARYRNEIPKEAHREYWHRYKIVKCIITYEPT